MPIDTGLLQQLRPLQVEPRENALMRALQMQGAMRQNQLAAMQYEQAQRDNALAQEYRSAWGQGADLNDPGTVKRLMSIDPARTQAALAANEKLLGERATREMHQAQTKGITSENEQKAKLRVLEGLGGVRDVHGAYDWMANAVQSGLMTKENAIRHAQTLEQNPQALNEWIVGMQSSGAPLKDQIERRTPKRTLQDTGKALVPVDLNPVTNPNLGPLAKTTTHGEDLSAETSRRGQDISARSAAAGRAQSERHFKATSEREAAPKWDPVNQVFVDPVKRTVTPAAGLSGAGKPPTESERTAGFLLQRIRDSQRQLDEAVKANPSAARPGATQEGARLIAEPLANAMTGPERQRVESAQLDILDAALTLGTGAAYTQEQIKGYRKSYFPQLGDSKEAIADKKARLDNLIRAAETKAGRAAADTAPKAKTPSVSNW